MNANDHVGYGMRDGRLLHISEVSRGLSSGCVCARCAQTLIAKKGAIRDHHFAHVKDTNCHGAAETILHLLAKELISELDEIVVPPYKFVKLQKTKKGVRFQHQERVAKGGIVVIDKISVEKRENDFIPDIIIESRSKSLIVEIAVTHKVTRAKLRKIRRRNLPAIEIRLDLNDSFLSRELLKTKLRKDLNSKMWLFHPDQRQVERVFYSKLRKMIASARAMRKHRPQYFVPPTRSKTFPRAVRPSLRPSLVEYDRTAEEFLIKHHRLPTMDECLRLWPHLWKP